LVEDINMPALPIRKLRRFPRAVAALCGASLALGGCATSSKDISATYVSPMQYQSYDCQQIQAELLRIQSRVAELGGRLDQASSNDKALVAGSILFWPALFALGGTKQQEAEYARLKGEYDALAQSAVQKKCDGAMGPTLRPASLPVPAPGTSGASPAAAAASGVNG
jgi:hypothetical protein